MIHWNVDPQLFHIGGLTVRWYGLFFAAAFLLGYEIMRRIYQLEGVRNLVAVDRLLVYSAIGTLVGARLGHTLIYEPEYFLSHPIEILMIWKGGLASHGAAVGILLAIWIYSRRWSFPFLWVMDRLCIV